MPESTEPYVPASPGDLITAEMWNRMQLRVHEDITATTQQAVEDIHEVDRAKDAAKLDSKTPRDLADEIVERALREMRRESGYRCIYTVLKAGEPRTIEHKLGLAPLVDLYRLEYFPAVYREDDQTYLSWANFYAYHASERSIRFTPPAAAKAISVEIEPSSGAAFKLRLSDLLERYHVEFDDDSSLEDLETEFWQAFFAAPNEGFADDQYGHSPWFERCCKEKTSVRQLKRAGDWDEICLKMVPVKQALFQPPPPPLSVITAETAVQHSARDLVQDVEITTVRQSSLYGPIVDVSHSDFDTTLLTLRSDPRVFYSEEERWKARLSPPTKPGTRPPVSPLPSVVETFPNAEKELKVMVLLKV